jgi:RimJ/RimL family protein N-acetyltransferase
VIWGVNNTEQPKEAEVPETERMLLRRPNWPDIDDVVALNADAEVMQFHGDGQPRTAAHVLSVEMPRLMADVRRSDDLGHWVARDRSTGEFLGWFTLVPVDGATVRTVVLDYRLRREAWGKGYGVEGTRRLVEMARAAEVETIVAMTMDSDLNGHRVMEGAGLQPVAASVGDATPVGAFGPGKRDFRLDLSTGAVPLEAGVTDPDWEPGSDLTTLGSVDR